MEEPKQADHAVTAVIVALTAMVSVLDLLTPLGIALWALHMLPLGFTRWSKTAGADGIGSMHQGMPS
jgi:hypothetical protein